MSLSRNLVARLRELATLDPEDITGWMHLYSNEAEAILRLLAEVETLQAVRSLVLEHNVSGAVLRTLLSQPTATTLQGMESAAWENVELVER